MLLPAMLRDEHFDIMAYGVTVTGVAVTATRGGLVEL